MSSHHVLYSIVGGLVLLVLTGCGGGSSDSSGPPSPNGFQALLGSTFTHPRCVVCHDFGTDSAVAQRHEDRSEVCSDCHDVPGWRGPIDAFSFSGISTAQICRGVKNKFGGDIAALRDHFATSTLTAWALNSGWVPGGARPTAPPNSVPALLGLVDQWIANGAVCD